MTEQAKDWVFQIKNMMGDCLDDSDLEDQIDMVYELQTELEIRVEQINEQRAKKGLG